MSDALATPKILDRPSAVASFWLFTAQGVLWGALNSNTLDTITMSGELTPEAVSEAGTTLERFLLPRRFVLVSVAIALVSAMAVLPWGIDRPYLFGVAPLLLLLFVTYFVRYIARMRFFLGERQFEGTPIIRRTYLLAAWSYYYPTPFRPLVVMGVLGFVLGVSPTGSTLAGGAAIAVALIAGFIMARQIWRTPWGMIRSYFALALLWPPTARRSLEAAARIDAEWVRHDLHCSPATRSV